MTRSVAVVVGVGNPPHLTPLPGAVAGAKDVARWAEGCGYEVALLTDEGRTVRTADVYGAIEAAVDARDVERLIVFFAGHGVSKGAYDDYWLLTNGLANPNESVNVPQSVSFARTCGIPHVVLVSDACRTMAGKDARGVLGSAIFPWRDRAEPVELDLFFAARSGDPAFERAPDSDRERAFGVFTRELVDVLLGRHPEVLDEVADDPPRWAVTAFRLRDYLFEAVPVAASRLGVQQTPDLIPGSRYPPNAVCWLDHLEPPRPSRRGIRGPGGPPRTSLAGDDLTEFASRFAAEEGRKRFETRTGLTVHGAQVLRAAGPGVDEVFPEGGAWQVRGAKEPSSVVLDVGDGRYPCLAMLPGFVGTIHVGEAGVDLVSYQAAGGSRFDEGQSAEIREAVAWLGAGLIAGIRDMAIDDASEQARYLRQFKFANPTFGIISAYAYDRAGNRAEVRSLADYFTAAGQVVPYDVAMLAGGAPERAEVAPSYPLLTHGWALLGPDTHPILHQAAAQLAPCTWATATGDSGEALLRAVDEGAFR